MFLDSGTLPRYFTQYQHGKWSLAVTDRAQYIYKEDKPIKVRQSNPELDRGRFLWHEDVVSSDVNRLLAGYGAIAFGGAKKDIVISQCLHICLDRSLNYLRAFVC